MKIQSFTDLIAWQKARELIIEVYVVAQEFPKSEIFSLISQIKRAAISIAANIAEGFSRKTKKDKTQFYFIALSSLTELQSHLVIARDLSYLTQENFIKLSKITIEISKLIHSLIKNL